MAAQLSGRRVGRSVGRPVGRSVAQLAARFHLFAPSNVICQMIARKLPSDAKKILQEGFIIQIVHRQQNIVSAVKHCRWHYTSSNQIAAQSTKVAAPWTDTAVV